MASTVVDTRRMGQGQLSFFRIGVVPRAHVESVFDSVKLRFNNGGPTLPPAITDTTTGGQVSRRYRPPYCHVRSINQSVDGRRRRHHYHRRRG